MAFQGLGIRVGEPFVDKTYYFKWKDGGQNKEQAAALLRACSVLLEIKVQASRPSRSVKSQAKHRRLFAIQEQETVMCCNCIAELL